VNKRLKPKPELRRAPDLDSPSPFLARGEMDGRADVIAAMPERGRAWPELRAEMQAMRERDLDWRRGRHGAFIWYADEDLESVLQEAYSLFLVENGLGVRVFPSLSRMERDVLAAVSWLLSGQNEDAGIFTSGGTESIFLALYAAREWARASRPVAEPAQIVAPFSAHPALSKAAHLLGMEVIRVPVAADHRADVAAIERAISSNSIGLYASAPSYALGVVDPISELGELALRHNLWLHVDACVGGILAPFVRQLGYHVPSFDFALPGVTSISADLHKSGFTAKPASTVSFRTSELREYARYRMSDWPAGTYNTLTFTGTRPGGAIAAAWAAFNYLGQEGYRRLAGSAMRAREVIVQGLGAISSVRVFGEPELWAFAFGSDAVDMHHVAGLMGKRGWVCPATTSPRGIHMMCTPVHEAIAEQYVSDIAACVEEARAVENPAAGSAAYN
jgi:sphinganine-1-phosphate aldolase